MRIVSLLPSLTELVHALGHGPDLVGVTHECDFPPGVEALPHLTRSRIPTSASSAEIDALVAGQGGSLYELDAELKPIRSYYLGDADAIAAAMQAVAGQGRAK